MAQIDVIRLADGTAIRPTEWTPSPHWSTVEVGVATDQTLTFFSYPLGGDVPGSVGPRKATFEDTNVEGSGGHMPENEELIIESISLEIFTDAVLGDGGFYDGNGDPNAAQPPENGVPNLMNLQRSLNLRLRIANEKPLLDHPIGYFPAASGFFPVTGAYNVADDPDAMTAAPPPMWGAQHGGYQCYDKRRLVTTHRVFPGQVWGLDLTFPEGAVSALDFGEDTNGRMVLRARTDGLHKRPVA